MTRGYCVFVLLRVTHSVTVLHCVTLSMTTPNRVGTDGQQTNLLILVAKISKSQLSDFVLIARNSDIITNGPHIHRNSLKTENLICEKWNVLLMLGVQGCDKGTCRNVNLKQPHYDNHGSKWGGLRQTVELSQSDGRNLTRYLWKKTLCYIKIRNLV